MAGSSPAMTVGAESADTSIFTVPAFVVNLLAC
jgi:hypothetical protein